MKKYELTYLDMLVLCGVVFLIVGLSYFLIFLDLAKSSQPQEFIVLVQTHPIP